LAQNDRVTSLGAVQEAALAAFPLIRDEVSSLFSRYISDHTDISTTLRMLFKYQSERSQTVSFLISYGYAWDAEIILRSFYEVTAKILFVCLTQEDQKAGLMSEFWEGLGDINNRRTARKAEFSEQISRRSGNAYDEAVFSFLQNERFFPKDDSFSRTQRKRLKQKWSFSEIIQSLSATSGLQEINSLFHMYGMASHLAHADCNALELMIDRDIRETDERTLLERAHLCRIMSDQVGLAFFSAEALRRHFKAEFENKSLFSVVDRFFRLTKPVSDAFDETQKEFYRSHGAKL